MSNTVIPRSWCSLKLVISHFGDLFLFNGISKLVMFYLVSKLAFCNFGGDALITNIEVLLYHIDPFLNSSRPKRPFRFQFPIFPILFLSSLSYLLYLNFWAFLCLFAVFLNWEFKTKKQLKYSPATLHIDLRPFC